MDHLRNQLNKLLDRWNQLRESHPREVRAALRVTAAAAIISIVATGWFLLSLTRSLPSKESLTRMTEMDQATAVYDASDTLAFTIFKEQRIDVPLESMGPYLVKALVAVEDRRFYDHQGFDAIRIVSVALKNVRNFRVVQGASTITQQLARTSFLTPDRTYRRKLQEVILAGRIEQHVLQGSNPRALSEQGLLRRRTVRRRSGVARLLCEARRRAHARGGGDARRAGEVAFELRPDREPRTRNHASQPGAIGDGRKPDTSTRLRGMRLARRRSSSVTVCSPTSHLGCISGSRCGASWSTGSAGSGVYQGGLRVYSTIDMTMQKAAETAIAEGLASMDKRRKTPDPEPLQAALIAMDPATGHVRAMVGGRDFE